ncbi:hypothetical protein [Lentzea sp. E54]|uniref:hypothetical protein n=1 Tax=Lentzea xerophila TaxID=3435883 RepID=UPI003DA4880C
MTAQLDRSDKHVLTATSELSAEYDGVLSSRIVADTVLGARRDLEGQIVPDAIGEMLHQLARYRLERLKIRA